MIDTVFDVCVLFLFSLANLLGTTYEAVNVWIFCVIMPIAFFALIGFLVYQAREIRRLALICDRKNILASNGFGLKSKIICSSSLIGDPESL